MSVTTLHAVGAIRCGCDPRDIAGLLPGYKCPSCQHVREPWPHQTAMVYLDDARHDLRVATGLVEKALLADYDGDSSRRDGSLAAAALIADRATNVLAFALASLAHGHTGASA